MGWKILHSHFKENKKYYLGGLILSTVAGYGLLLLAITWPIDKFTVANAGVFGDSFGVITCLFTALGFLGLLINLFEQRTYIALQQANAKKQEFESNFFQMLNHLNEITKDIGHTKNSIGDDPPSIYYGREAIYNLATLYRLTYGPNLSTIVSGDDINSFEHVTKSFETFWDHYGIKLSHYFRWLYNLLKFVESRDDIDKDFYVKLISAQLSNQELFLIFYSALTERGRNFQKFIIKYDMMSNFEPSELLNASHTKFIASTKFWGS